MKNLVIIGIVAVVAACWLTTPNAAAIDSSNIMGMWLFNEGNGNTAEDSSGNGNDGKIHGAKWVDGKFGKALEFDGTDDWVEVAHSNTLGFTKGTSFTITVHFKGTKVVRNNSVMARFQTVSTTMYTIIVIM